MLLESVNARGSPFGLLMMRCQSHLFFPRVDEFILTARTRRLSHARELYSGVAAVGASLFANVKSKPAKPAVGDFKVRDYLSPSCGRVKPRRLCTGGRTAEQFQLAV